MFFFHILGALRIFFTAPKIKIELWNDGLEDVFSFSRGPVFSGSSRSSSSVYPNLVPNPWPGICAMHIPLFSRDGFGRFWGLQNVNFPNLSNFFACFWGCRGGRRFCNSNKLRFFGRKSGGFRKVDCFFAQNYHFDILLTEEILHHLGCIKPCQYWDKLPTSTGEPDVFHQQCVMGRFPWTEQRTRWKHGRAHVRVF